MCVGSDGAGRQNHSLRSFILAPNPATAYALNVGGNFADKMRDKQYKGKLTPKQAAEGIKAAIENAASLLTDAKLLFDNGRFERSVALSVLAIEEAGKISIIRSILLEDDPGELKKSWQQYRRHTDKNLSWILPELTAKGARQLEDMRPIFDENSDHV